MAPLAIPAESSPQWHRPTPLPAPSAWTAGNPSSLGSDASACPPPPSKRAQLLRQPPARVLRASPTFRALEISRRGAAGAAGRRGCARAEQITVLSRPPPLPQGSPSPSPPVAALWTRLQRPLSRSASLSLLFGVLFGGGGASRFQEAFKACLWPSERPGGWWWWWSCGLVFAARGKSPQSEQARASVWLLQVPHDPPEMGPRGGDP